MKMCVASVKYSILVNGEVVSYFKGKKGQRQGHLISPVLFTLVMELLSSLLYTSQREKRFLPHPSNRIGILHLCFGDDMLLFMRGEYDSVRGAMEILEVFSSYTGLYLNKQKMKLIVSSDVNGEVQLWAN